MKYTENTRQFNVDNHIIQWHHQHHRFVPCNPTKQEQQQQQWQCHQRRGTKTTKLQSSSSSSSRMAQATRTELSPRRLLWPPLPLLFHFVRYIKHHLHTIKLLSSEKRVDFAMPHRGKVREPRKQVRRLGKSPLHGDYIQLKRSSGGCGGWLQVSKRCNGIITTRNVIVGSGAARKKTTNTSATIY